MHQNKKNLWADILASKWVAEKCQDDSYAQNLYAAFCNMRWIPEDVFEILKDEYWSASWRSAGGLIAEIRPTKNEDYLHWYCSGMGGFSKNESDDRAGYVSEGTVTDEIKEDMHKLGWLPYPWPEI